MISGRAAKQIDPTLKPEELARQAYVKAVRLLGARDHSRAEITAKLQRNGFNADTISQVLLELGEAGYQSDERFANLYAEQLVRKHQGPLAISAKLAARGIDSALSKQAIENLGVCWGEIAAEALHARYSLTELTDSDQNQKGKIARFLNRRGFSSTDSIKAIRLAIETVPE